MRRLSSTYCSHGSPPRSQPTSAAFRFSGGVRCFSKASSAAWKAARSSADRRSSAQSVTAIADDSRNSISQRPGLECGPSRRRQQPPDDVVRESSRGKVDGGGCRRRILAEHSPRKGIALHDVGRVAIRAVVTASKALTTCHAISAARSRGLSGVWKAACTDAGTSVRKRPPAKAGALSRQSNTAAAVSVPRPYERPAWRLAPFVSLCSSWEFNGAGNETRTRDPNLGKVVLYQLSYSRSDRTVILYHRLRLVKPEPGIRRRAPRAACAP